jgi:fumarate reductase subunit C
MSTYWWLKKTPYLAFIARELSSLFVAWSVVYLLLLIRAIGRGDSAYRSLIDWSAHPVIVLLNAITLLFVVYHAITWFNLAPQAMVVRMGGRRVPGAWIVIQNYAAWALVSGLVIWIVLN